MSTLFTHLPVFVQAVVLLVFAFVALFTVLSGIAKSFGWKRATALFASLAIDFGKAGAVLQGHLPVNKPLPPIDEETGR